MPELIELNNTSRVDKDPDRVLRKAIGNMESAIVIGWDKNGDFYAESSIADGGGALWLLEVCKRRLMEWGEE